LSSRIKPIIRKEFIHISRDSRTLAIVILMPVVMLFLYGFALNMELQNINLAIVDNSRTPESSELIRRFQGSDFFSVFIYDGPLAEVGELFSTRTAHAVLIIPQDFARNMPRRASVDVQILIDATDSNRAQAIRNYINAVVFFLNADNGATAPFTVEPTVWYNPSLRSAYFFIPGLAALILIMISALLTSIAIVREKETGTMEQILVSPIRPVEIVVGKVIPYVLLAFLDLLIVLAVAKVVYRVPVVGSMGFLLLASLIFIFVALSLGLLISTKAQTQQVAMMLALVATLLPTVILSGFIFPLDSLPAPLWALSHFIPARYFMVIIRGIMLKGNQFSHLWPELSVLLTMGLVLMIVSVRKFSTTIDT